MNTWLSHVIVLSLIIMSFYFSIKQLKHTRTLQKRVKNKEFKFLVMRNYLLTFALWGFLISYILNFLVYLGLFTSKIFTSNNTSLLCFMFLIIIFVLQYIIKERNIF